MRALAGTVAALAVWCSGCLEPGLVDCGDGHACPVDSTCVVGGCYAPAQIEACANAAEGDACTLLTGTGQCVAGGCLVAVCGNGVVETGEACDDGNVANGDGCSGRCDSDESCGNGIAELDEVCDCGDADHPGGARCEGTFNGGDICNERCGLRRCGNGEVDPGETCDDGNNVSNDGCSFDCKSVEKCGNNTLDFLAGEECDDGNTRNRDGCSAHCRKETLEWTSLPIGTVPSPRYGATMAYDPARRVVVLFGGNTQSGTSSETWEWNGIVWLRRQTAHRPSTGAGPLVWDTKRQRLVLVRRSNAIELWEYDGFDWKVRPQTGGPTGFGLLGFAYDSGHDRLVVLDTKSSPTPATFVWDFDGTTWSERLLTNKLPYRTDGSLVYDPVRDRMILYGGTSIARDTWELGPDGWTQVTTTNKPVCNTTCNLVFDAKREYPLVVLPTGETWQYDATDWTKLPAPTTFSSRPQSAIAYDAGRQRVVLFGGLPNSGISGETWELDDNDWAIRPTYGVLPNGAGQLSYDAGEDLIALLQNRLRRLARSAWFLGEVSPADVDDIDILTYDAAHSRLLIVSHGADPVTSENIGWTYEWDPNQGWNYHGVQTPVMTYGLPYFDTARNLVVVVDPTTSPVTLNEYDGEYWTQRTFAQGPSLASTHVAYDMKRQRLVLIGTVIASNPPVTETWELDGTTWERRTPTVPAPDSQSGGMVFDQLRERIVVFASSSGTGFDTEWEYDGTTWSAHEIAGAPPGRTGAQFTYDPRRGQTVAFGGEGLLDTWFAGYQSRELGEACESGIDFDGDGLVGCNDSDCAGSCAPVCASSDVAACATGPHCGDGVCSPAETCRGCPADCPTGTEFCPTLCGDFFCDAPETSSTCPGDCL